MPQILGLRSLATGISYNLLAGTIRLLADGWKTRTPVQGADFDIAGWGARLLPGSVEPVIETIVLGGTGTDAELLTALGTLNNLREQARIWHADPFEDDSIWLEWQAEGESALKHALVYSIDLDISSQDFTSPILGKGALYVTLAITRHPFWEAMAATQETPPNVSAWGGTFTIGASAIGRAPSRIERIRVAGDTGTIKRIWVGGRAVRDGSSGFVEVWELELGTLGTDASIASEVGASPNGSSINNKISVSFVTPSNAKRLAIKAGQVAAVGFSHFLGRYLVLLRTKLSAGSSEVLLSIKAGPSGASSMESSERIFFADTNWRVIEMGEVTIPPWGGRSTAYAASSIAEFTIEIWAERLSGTATLDLDALVLVPAEHFMFMDGTTIQPTPLGTAAVWSRADDTSFALGESAPSVIDAGLTSIVRNLYVPARAGAFFVVVGERDASHVLTDQVDMLVDYVERWPAFRS